MSQEENRTGRKADYTDTTGPGGKLAKALGGMSQTQAAKELKISQTSLNRMIHGQRIPGIELARRIRDRFQIPMDAWTVGEK